MTPRQHKEYAEAEEAHQKLEAQRKAEKWHVPLWLQALTLEEGLKTMKPFQLKQGDIPLVIKLTENPKYKIARNLGGAVDLFTHDCIHILLGRGVLLKDEAFVIGYTMGSSKKMKRWKRNLFMFICKYLYPEGYKFGEDERFVFNMGVMLGSRCETDLSSIDFSDYERIPLYLLRRKLSIDTTALRASYEIEKRIFPLSPESQRLF
jgi:hypothetical protein